MQSSSAPIVAVSNGLFSTATQTNEVAGNQRIILTQFGEMFSHTNAVLPIVTGSVPMPLGTPVLMPIMSQSDRMPFVGQFTIPATVQLTSSAQMLAAPTLRFTAPTVRTAGAAVRMPRLPVRMPSQPLRMPPPPQRMPPPPLRMPPPLSPVQHPRSMALPANVQSSTANRSMSTFKQVALSNGAQVCLPKNCTLKVIQRHPTESRSVTTRPPIPCKPLPVKSSPNVVDSPRNIATSVRTIPSTTKNQLNGRVVTVSIDRRLQIIFRVKHFTSFLLFFFFNFHRTQ